MFCYKCGKQVADDAAFCLFCGTKLVAGNSTAASTQPEPAEKKPLDNRSVIMNSVDDKVFVCKTCNLLYSHHPMSGQIKCVLCGQVAEEWTQETPVMEEPVAKETPAEAPVMEEPVAKETPAEAPSMEEPVAKETPVEAPSMEEPATQEVSKVASAQEGPSEIHHVSEADSQQLQSCPDCGEQIQVGQKFCVNCGRRL